MKTRATQSMAGMIYCAALALGGSSPAFALSQSDFIADMHAINQAEIKAGATAQKRGQSAAVVSFGKTLVADHRSADAKLAAFAKAHAFSLTPNIEGSAALAIQRHLDAMNTELLSVPAASFDSDFLRKMVDAHRDAIKLVGDAKPGFYENPDFEDFTSTIFPMLEMHEREAQRLEVGLAH